MIDAPSQREYRDYHSGNRYGPLPGGEELGMAAHESAHAICAAALGYRVTRVTLEHSANDILSWDGVCHYQGGDGWDATTRAVRSATVAVAAYAGQQDLEGPVQFSLPDRIFGGDSEQLQECADTLGVDYNDLRGRCLATARDLLARHAATWRMVTYALVRYGEIDGAYLERVDASLFRADASEPAVPSLDAGFRDQAIAALTYFQRNPPAPGSQAHALLDRLEAGSGSPGHHRRWAPSYRIGNTTIETRMGGPLEYRSGR